MRKKLEKPKLDIDIVNGNFYWVRPYQKDEFEPAKCKDRYGDGKLWFGFTNGSVMEVERAWEVKPLVFKNEPVFNIDSILRVIDKLPHSKSRVPYTYHHDYLREHSEKYKGMSRSDVASSHDSSDEELYSIALTQLLDELGSKSHDYLNPDDIHICLEAKKVTIEALRKYDCATHEIVNYAMKEVSKDVRDPKCVRDGIVEKPKN